MRALDPRVKLVGAALLAVWIGLVPAAWVGGLALALVALAAASRVPIGGLLARSAAALPFVLVPVALGLATGSFEPARAGLMAIRGTTAALVAALFAAVTPAPAILSGASALGAPALFVQTLALLLRYLDVLQERARAMIESARARGYGPRAPARLRTAGSLVGALLVRSLDRAERVHRSMLARGYTGAFPPSRPLQMRAADWAASAVIGLFPASLVWLW